MVATPIGNLGDMTPRAVDTLRAVDVVLCEDTRHSRPLLAHFGIATPVASLHEHNEAHEAPRVVARLREGGTAALISDAGTPLLSDPGERLVRAAIDAGLPVVPLPGASAVLAALVVAGFPSAPFTFVGFLPRKGRERAAQLAMLGALPHVGILYESPHRVADTLDDLAASLGASADTRRAVVARELTKRFEEVRRGPVAELARHLRVTPPRGEVVIVLEGAAPAPVDEASAAQAAAALREAGASAREIRAELMARHGISRNLAYRLAEEA